MRLLFYSLLLLLLLRQLDATCNNAAMSKVIQIFCSNPSASAFLCFKFRNCVASIKKAGWTPWKNVGVVDKENANCLIDEPAVIITRSTNETGVSERCRCYVRHENKTICKSEVRLIALNEAVGVGVGFTVPNGQIKPIHAFQSESKSAIIQEVLPTSSSQVKQCSNYSENDTFDLAIIMDSSGSVGKKNFALVKQSLKDVVRILCNDYTACQNGPKLRLAVITYGRIAKVVFDFNRSAELHRSNDDIVRDIEEKMNYMSFHDGRTATGAALSIAEERVFNCRNGMRQHSKKRILLLTDGHWNYGVDPREVSKRLCINTPEMSIYAFGIGDNIDKQELQEITDACKTRNEGNLFYITLFYSFVDFNTFVENLNQTSATNQTCKTGEIVDRKRR